MSMWCSARASDSSARGSGFKYQFLQIFILNSVEFLQNLIRKNSIEIIPKYSVMMKIYSWITTGKWPKKWLIKSSYIDLDCNKKIYSSFS